MKRTDGRERGRRPDAPESAIPMWRAGPAGLYRVKPAAQRILRPPAARRILRPLEDRLSDRGVRADALTFAAVPVAAAGGTCLALADRVPFLLLAVPVLAAARLVLNLLDGQVARRSGTARAMGEVWNETSDRLADTLFIGGLAFLAAVGPLLALSASSPRCSPATWASPPRRRVARGSTAA